MEEEWIIEEDEELAKEIEKLERESKNERRLSLAEYIREFGKPRDIAYLEKEHFTKPQPIKCKFCGSYNEIRGKKRSPELYL